MNKKGLNHAPQDFSIHSDRKIQLLLNEYGAIGYLIYDYVQMLCFKSNGYWVAYDDTFCLDAADVLKCGTTGNCIREILKYCFSIRLFDANIFKEYRIITSADIQKRYLSVKKNGKIEQRLLLINIEKKPIPVDIKKWTDAEKVKAKKIAFRSSLEEYRGKYPDEMLFEFLRYWGESDRSGKLKYEKEATWELNLRLIRWEKNTTTFKK